MAFITNRLVNLDLDEELRSLGAKVTTEDMKILSTRRLDESIYGGALVKSHQGLGGAAALEEDPIDGSFVTMELLSRIADLDFDSLDEDDVEQILDGLREKTLPEGDLSLAESARDLVTSLLEAMKRIAGGQKSIRVKTGAEETKAQKAYKVYKRTKGGKAAKKKAKRWRGSAAGKQSLKRSKKRAMKSRARNRNASYNLADELRHLQLSENVHNGEYAETIERIGRVLDLISEWIDEPEVEKFLEESYETLCTSLYENHGDFEEVARPIISVIKRCLEEIDEEGN